MTTAFLGEKIADHISSSQEEPCHAFLLIVVLDCKYQAGISASAFKKVLQNSPHLARYGDRVCGALIHLLFQFLTKNHNERSSIRMLGIVEYFSQPSQEFIIFNAIPMFSNSKLLRNTRLWKSHLCPNEVMYSVFISIHSNGSRSACQIQFRVILQTAPFSYMLL